MKDVAPRVRGGVLVADANRRINSRITGRNNNDMRKLLPLLLGGREIDALLLWLVQFLDGT